MVDGRVADETGGEAPPSGWAPLESTSPPAGPYAGPYAVLGAPSPSTPQDAVVPPPEQPQDELPSRRRPYRRQTAVAIAALVGALLLLGGLPLLIVLLRDSGDDGATEREPSVAVQEPTTVDQPVRSTTSSAPPATEPVVVPAPPTTEAEVLLVVGQDIQPGRYMAPSPGFTCYWERVSGLSGSFDEIIVNGALPGTHPIVDILASDAGFRTAGCGDWTPYSPPASPATTFEDGDWLVGSDIVAGTYRSTGPGGELPCWWERASGFTHDYDEVITYDATEEPAVVELHAGERFTSETCGTWTLQ